jgi:predicted RNase H-like HicB family nuclease
MPLMTIVEDFIIAAMKRARVEEFENGVLGASIPECPGVVAFGADQHECARNLYAQLDEWVAVSLTAQTPLPVLDGIDLNRQSDALVATYHSSRGAAGRYFDDADAFKDALADHSSVAQVRNSSS